MVRAIAAFPHWDGVYFLVLGYPLPPYSVQNLENKGSNLRLGARSLSLQELHAKSREHGSYGGRDGLASHFGIHFELGRARHLERGLEATPAPGSDCQRSTIIL
jgi:hypothetical protein